MELKEKITEVVNGFLAEEPSLFMIDTQVKGKNKIIIAICLDGDQGVSIEQCASISRRVAASIEEQELIEGAYQLEVSSPGADSPLVSKRQFPQHVGRKLAILLSDESELSGKLVSTDTDGVLIEAETSEKGKKKPKIEERQIPYTDIKTAKVVLAFK